MANGPSYARARWLSDEEVESLEGLDLGSLRRALGPVQKQLGAALPGMVQGATAGSAAGPWGALIGAVAGGALSATRRPGRRAAAGGPAAQVAPPAGAPPVEPVAAPPAAAPSPDLPPGPAVTPTVAAPLPVATPAAAPTAAGQLAQLLQNPVLHKAIGSLAAGQGGASSSGVPVGAILNLLGTLAGNAAHEAEASGAEMDDAYLRDDEGSWQGDPHSPAERAAAVWERLFEQPADAVTPSEADDDPGEWLVETGLAARI